MKLKDIAKLHGFDVDILEYHLKSVGIEPTGFIPSIPNEDVERAVASFKQYLEDKKPENRARIAEEKARAEAEHRAELAKILITSGFNFDGYKVVKYSGYISGDDAISVDREYASWRSDANNVKNKLMESLVVIRRNALNELKEAAFDLGCNAVIGVDFDYLTLEPETANLHGGTTYLPYVFGVTANGNAVVIEKIED